MCGFAGISDPSFRQGEAETILASMARAIEHRGPDDQGVWYEGRSGLGLSFRRLSILDLSANGHQPMVSSCGRYHIVFNGEIYNHQALKNILAAQDPNRAASLRGHADTEIFIESIATRGVEKALENAEGMFAFAVWDSEKRMLTLGRDRAGEKPLYYGWHRGSFLFGSELKAFTGFPGWSGQIDSDAFLLFLRHNYIPAPFSIYQGIYKLLPGAYLELSENDLRKKPSQFDPHQSVKTYWDKEKLLGLAQAHPFEGNAQEAVDELDRILLEVIGLEKFADVPVGAFLSGGVDSSTIVALMAKENPKSVKTFTIGFTEKQLNEADHAKRVAEHLGTDHHELYVPPELALSVIPKLSYLYDEPFSDSSQIPTFLVAKLAREKITVSLSGDGADELFGGYTRYTACRSLWDSFAKIPGWGRGALGNVVESSAPLLAGLGAGSWLPERFQGVISPNRLQKLGQALKAQSLDGIYRSFMIHAADTTRVTNLRGRKTFDVWTKAQTKTLDPFSRMMFLDLGDYLPDDILVKVDRATMGVSLESRAPYLHPKVIEFAWRLPLEFKFRNGNGKWILRELLSRYVPTTLTDRPKMGFGMPVGAWLKGPLRPWAEELLSPALLDTHGLFDKREVRSRWEQHLSGKADWQYLLWDILMFQSWFEKWMKPSTSASLSTQTVRSIPVN